MILTKIMYSKWYKNIFYSRIYQTLDGFVYLRVCNEKSKSIVFRFIIIVSHVTVLHVRTQTKDIIDIYTNLSGCQNIRIYVWCSDIYITKPLRPTHVVYLMTFIELIIYYHRLKLHVLRVLRYHFRYQCIYNGNFFINVKVSNT